MMPDQNPNQAPVPSSVEGPVPSHVEGPVPSSVEGPVPSHVEGHSYARPTELAIMAAIVVVDQLTKEIVRRTLPLHGEPAQLIPGFLDLTHVQNTGAAFGLLNAAEFP